MGHLFIKPISQVFEKSDIYKQLNLLRVKERSQGAHLIAEARRVLKEDLFTEKKILENLGRYNSSFQFLDENELDSENLFSQIEIKRICIVYRLKFLESKVYKPEIPYEAVLRIKKLNERFTKDLKEFRILAPAKSFSGKLTPGDSMLFAKTMHDNYYLIHRWGEFLPWYRRFKYWPLRNFENLFLTIIGVTLFIALSLPIGLITLDSKADYWSGYWAAAFFHLLIFNMGVTAYIGFAFAKNFSSSVWNREHDFS